MVFVLNNKQTLVKHTLISIHKSLDQFTGMCNMLKHGLFLAILIITIIHVTFGGITETKGLVFVFLILSQFFQIGQYILKANYGVPDSSKKE